MANFAELLSASDVDLVKIFYQVKAEPSVDFIKNINSVATQLALNHSQLVCALGFNKNVSELTDIIEVLGFKSHQLLTYRRNELFTTDAYMQLDIENILHIYMEHKKSAMLETLRELLPTRLESIESDLGKNDNASHAVSYRMEIHAVYQSGIANKAFVEQRLAKDIGKYRHMAKEINEIITLDLFPPSNFFFMETISPEEKAELIEQQLISPDMVKNRLQNSAISEGEREVLENFI